MKSENTVYVLGAGFSKAVGFPLSSEMVSESMFDYLLDKLGKNKSLISKIQKIRSYVRYRIDNGYCTEDIESVLNHVATAKYLYMESTTEESKPYSADDIFLNLLWFVTRLLKEKTIDSITKIPNEYSIFLKKLYKNNDSIITFNYDLLIESVLNSLNYRYRYGVDEKMAKKEQLILKLHGSLNWASCSECGPVNLHDKILTFEADSKEVCPLCKSDKLTSIVIPPVIYKDSYYNDQLYGPLVRESWALAQEELSKTKKIVFIGFSMVQDAYAQELFKLSLNMNPEKALTCLVVNPTCSDELRERYQKVLVNEKCNFKETSFIDYVKNI